MSKIRFVGLDVHEQSITIAVADEGDAGPTVFRRIPHDLNTLVRALKDLSARATLKVAYEAGPTGFGMYRKLSKAGIECHVIAPSHVPKNGRQKNDQEDALRIARFLRSGDLVAVYVPTAEVEALRTLTRCREDAIKSQQTARGQLRQFLVREDRKYTGTTKWNKAHLDWIRALEFDHPAKAITRDDYVREVEGAAARIARLTKDIETLAPKSSLAPMVTALQALQGVDLLTAVTIAAEIGDFMRFAKAKHFMSYLGLVPKESSSGEREWRGSITKAGNSHMRRVLGESAQAYRHPGRSKSIALRRQRAPEPVRAIADKAQQRLHERWKRLSMRGKQPNKVTIAIARELAGFVWAIGREMQKAERNP